MSPETCFPHVLIGKETVIIKLFRILRHSFLISQVKNTNATTAIIKNLTQNKIVLPLNEGYLNCLGFLGTIFCFDSFILRPINKSFHILGQHLSNITTWLAKAAGNVHRGTVKSLLTLPRNKQSSSPPNALSILSNNQLGLR